MSYSDYSFLDLTVMGFLRKRVISQDAVVLFTHQLDRVLWANAHGARLFSGNGVAELLDTKLSSTHPLMRQIAGAARQVEGDEAVVRRLRVNHGLNSELIVSEVSQCLLPNGELVVLLSCPHEDGEKRLREHQLAAAAVTSLEDFAKASAILDEYGLVLAASEEFEDLEIDPENLELLVHEVDGEADRLVKRMVKAGDGALLPAGLGKIRDNPSRILAVLAEPVESLEEPVDDGKAPSADNDDIVGYDKMDDSVYEAALNEQQPIVEANPSEKTISVDISHDEAADSNAADGNIGDIEVDEPGQELEDDILPAAAKDSEPLSQDGAEAKADELGANELEADELDRAIEAESTNYSSLLDRIEKAEGNNDDTIEQSSDEEAKDKLDVQASEAQAGTEQDEAVDPRQEEPVASTSLSDLASKIVHKNPSMSMQSGSNPDSGQDNETKESTNEVERFAFTIDRDQVVQSVSDGLARVVGKKSADIVGYHWTEIANARGFDEYGTILKLLKKADTWSGRSILWPIEGTDMTVPVDLAALPAFDKDRQFDGFRGFGVIRTADTVIDPNGLGLKLDDVKHQSSIAPLLEQSEGDDVTWSDKSETGEQSISVTDRLPPSFHVDPDKVIVDDDDTTTNVESSSGADNVFMFDKRRKQSGDDDGHKGPASLVEKNHDDQVNGSLSQAQTDEDAKLKLSGSEHRNFTKIKHTLSGGQASEALPATESVNQQEPVADLINSSQSGHLVMRGGVSLFANPAFFKLTGYETIEEFETAGGVDNLFSEFDFVEGEEQAFGIRVANKGMFIRSKDDDLLGVDCHLHKLEWDGSPALCLVFDEKSDSSFDEKIAMDKVRVSELENIIDTAADGIMIVDEDGLILLLNNSGETLFGHSQSEVGGKQFTDLFAKEDEDALKEYAALIASENVENSTNVVQHSREVTGIGAHGQMIPMYVTLGRVGDEGNLCAVLRDLTAWKSNESELENARKNAEIASDQKTQFLTRVGHEIREPLTAIIGFSDIMLEERFGPVDNERYREYLKDINKSGVHVLDLVNDLMDITKIEAGKLELKFEAVDLNKISSETTSLLQPQSGKRRILVRTSLSSAVPNVVADVRSIRQILLNLLGNSINHSPENTQVIVSTALEENGEVSLRVRDTGNGLSEEELQNILSNDSEFFNGEDPLNSKISAVEGQKSTSRHGLGLPLTKALVEANRAYMEIESTVGEGTVVHIIFPSQRVLSS